MSDDALVLQSVSGSAQIRFSKNGAFLLLTIDCADFSARHRFSGDDYETQSLLDAFRELANIWRKWDEPVIWGDLEETIEFSAIGDNRGHVAMSFSLKTNNDQRMQLRFVLDLEAGQFADIYGAAIIFFGRAGLLLRDAS